MFKLLIFNIFRIFLILLLDSGVLADDSTIYKVENVVIDVTDTNSELARSKAIKEAQKKAFYRLLDWMTLTKDKSLFSNKEVFNPQDFALSYSVNDEKVTETRYRAKFTVHFDPITVKRLLVNLGVKFTEIKGETVLVLPVLKWGSVITLWDNPNPWFDVWLKQPIGIGLVPLILPYADVTDLTTLTAMDALSLESARLRALARRYNAKSVIVAIAQITESPEGDDALLVEIRKLEGEKIKIFDPLIFNEVESLNVALEEGLNKVKNYIDDTWANEHMSNSDSFKEFLDLNVYFDNFEDWRNIRSILDNLKLIREYRILELSINYAQIIIDFHGDFELSRQGLVKEGVMLEWNKGWNAQLLKKSEITNDIKDIETEFMLEELYSDEKNDLTNTKDVNELLVE